MKRTKTQTTDGLGAFRFQRVLLEVILVLFFSSQNNGSLAQASELTVYVYPSPYGIQWKTPKALVRSALVNHFLSKSGPGSHEIGHISIELQCDSLDRIEKTGMTDDGVEFSRFLIKDKMGLGILFQPLKGKLQTQEEVEDSQVVRFKSKRISWLKLRISETACLRLNQYLEEFRSLGIEQVYGLPFRPRHQEGSGCSAFGISFLELVGFLTPELKSAWSRQIRVPVSLLKKQSLIELLFGSVTNRWALDGEEAKEIFFYDPDLIYEWILAKRQEIKNRHSNIWILDQGPEAFQANETNEGLSVDFRKAPTPTEPIWLN